MGDWDVEPPSHLVKSSRLSRAIPPVTQARAYCLDEQKIELSPGETVMISAGTPHVFTAIGNKQARGLVVAAPSAFARLVATVRTKERANPLDIELFDRISDKIGDEILGSPGTFPPLLPQKCNHWKTFKNPPRSLIF